MLRYFAMLCLACVLSLFVAYDIQFTTSMHIDYRSRTQQLFDDARNLNISEEELDKWREVASKFSRYKTVGQWTSFSNPYLLFKKRGLGYPDDKAYLELQNSGVYLFSAVGLNLTASHFWDFIALTAWETRKLLDTKFSCCFKYMNKVRQFPVLRKISYKETRGRDMELVQGRQYMCRNSYNGKSKELPIGVSVVKAAEKCPKDKRYYIQPVFPDMPPPSSFAVCAKVVFGNIEANSLIEWIEYQRQFGVTKVVIYVSYDISDSAIHVINHYYNENFVEVIPVGKLPRQEQQRDWESKDNFNNVAQDTAVILFDFQTRCHSYTFGGVIDPDEFVLPTDGSTSYIRFMANILKTRGREKMGYIRITPEFHITDWGPDNKTMPLTLARYKYHTPPMDMSYKNFYVTSRVQHGSIATHTVKAKEIYYNVTIGPKEAVIRHFRSCDGKFKDDLYNQCIAGKNRIKDGKLGQIAKLIYPRVAKVRKELGIKFP